MTKTKVFDKLIGKITVDSKTKEELIEWYLHGDNGQYSVSDIHYITLAIATAFSSTFHGYEHISTKFLHGGSIRVEMSEYDVMKWELDCLNNYLEPLGLSWDQISTLEKDDPYPDSIAIFLKPIGHETKHPDDRDG